MMTPEKLCETCYSGSFKEHRRDRRQDIIYRTFDNWCYDGEFDKVEQFVSIIDLSKVCASILYGILCNVSPASCKLKNWPEFKVRVKARAIELKDDIEMFDSYMQGVDNLCQDDWFTRRI